MQSYPEGEFEPQADKPRNNPCLAVILGAVLALAIGCGVKDLGSGRGAAPGGNFRWPVDDTSRMLRTARYYILMGRADAAVQELEEAHRRNPGNIKVAATLAQIYDEMGQGKLAQQLYQQALALEPQNPVLLNNLGFSYYLTANDAEAARCFRQILSSHPGHTAARNNLGLLLCREGRQDEARRLWAEAPGETGTERMAEALAALGIAEGARYARAYPSVTVGQESHPAKPLRRQLAAAASAASPVNSPGPTPAAPASFDPEPHPTAAPSAASPEKLASRSPGPPAPDSLSPAAPKAPAGGERVASPAPASRRGISSLSAGSQPKPAAPSPTLTATAGPAPDDFQAATSARPPTGPPPALASKPGPARVARGGACEKAPVARPKYLTARELIDTRIAILNGNGVHYQAHETRSQLSQEGFTVSAIGNFRDFGVERTVIYYHPDAKEVAAVLNQKFFPMAEVEAAPQLTGKVDVKVVLGRDLLPQQYAGALEAPANRPL